MSMSCDNINPHMKFEPPKIGVVSTPASSPYSLNAELAEEEQYYKDFLKSIDRKRRARFSEKHPTLSKNISDLIKLSTAIGAAVVGFRYRHSIPLVKNIFKNPKKTPPDFLTDLKNLWQKIIK